jgi:hypothetical protein
LILNVSPFFSIVVDLGMARPRKSGRHCPASFKRRVPEGRQISLFGISKDKDSSRQFAVTIVTVRTVQPGEGDRLVGTAVLMLPK